MILVRKLVLMCMQNNIFFKSFYISTKSNLVADALSRNQVQWAKKLAPYLEHHPTPLPPQLDLLNLLSA